MKDHTDDPGRVLKNHAWSGSRYIDVMDPRPSDIVLEEIAVGLSRETRYGGACTSEPWSVGQHSLTGLHFAVMDGITARKVLLAILLHDAPEYMLRDLIRPVKRNCPDYLLIEDRWWWAISRRFDLPFDMPPQVKHYDDLVLAAEKAALIDPNAGDWPGVPEAIYALPEFLRCMSNEAVSKLFQTNTLTLM